MPRTAPPFGCSLRGVSEFEAAASRSAAEEGSRNWVDDPVAVKYQGVIPMRVTTATRGGRAEGSAEEASFESPPCLSFSIYLLFDVEAETGNEEKAEISTEGVEEGAVGDGGEGAVEVAWCQPSRQSRAPAALHGFGSTRLS